VKTSRVWLYKRSSEARNMENVWGDDVMVRAVSRPTTYDLLPGSQKSKRSSRLLSGTFRGSDHEGFDRL
jgi:hypothetical protein